MTSVEKQTASLEQECQDIANKLGRMILQEQQQQQQQQQQQNSSAVETQPEQTATASQGQGHTAPLKSALEADAALREEEKREKKKRKKKRNKKKKKKGKNEGSSQGDGEEAEQNGSIERQKGERGERKKKRRGRRRFEDRYFGRFHCKICNRMWESAFVFTIAGTKKVKYKQGCQNCRSDEAWCYPYALDIISCSVCGESPCECRCEDCDGLIHIRYWQNADKNGREEEDPHFEYCECERDKRWMLGGINDEKKPHLSDLCGRCRSGRPCRRAWPQEVVEEDAEAERNGDGLP